MVLATTTNNNVDYRLLDRLSDLVICSYCLQLGKVTPVPQVISNRSTLTNECPSCRRKRAAENGSSRTSGTLHTLSQ
jgi:hypothetical protein